VVRSVVAGGGQAAVAWQKEVQQLHANLEVSGFPGRWGGGGGRYAHGR